MAAWFIFLVLAVALLTGATMAIRSTDLVHSVLWLAVVLVTTAVVYVVLQADFLAAVQILLYTGGVITLMLFAVMLTRRLEGASVAHGSRDPLRAVGALISIVVLIGFAIVRSVPFGKPAPASSVAGATEELGALFLTELMLPFEVLSVLLLAAMIGAIALARREGGQAPRPLEHPRPPIKEIDAEPAEGRAR